MTAEQEKEVRTLLLETVKKKLTDPIAMGMLGEKLFRSDIQWTNPIAEKIAEIVNRYLEREARKSPDVRIEDQVLTAPTGKENDFVISAKVREIFLEKESAGKKYHSKFISGESIYQAWRYIYGDRKDAPGKKTWNVLVLFLNAFPGYDFEDYHDWVAFALNISPQKKDSEQKNVVEEIKEDISTDHVWGLYSASIDLLLKEIYIFSVNKNRSVPLCITLCGNDGIGKFRFTSRIIQKYLFSLQLIKNTNLIRLYPNDLNEKRLQIENLSKQEKITKVYAECKDGILVLDGWNETNPDIKLCIDLIQKIISSEDYKHTAIALIGRGQYVVKIINEYRLTYFSKNFSMQFFSLSDSMLSKLFANYVREKENYRLTEQAKRTAGFYFKQLKRLKEMKARLKRSGIIDCRYIERKFLYGDEFKFLFLSLRPLLINKSMIDSDDIINCEQYKNVKQEYVDLVKKHAKKILSWF